MWKMVRIKGLESRLYDGCIRFDLPLVSLYYLEGKIGEKMQTFSDLFTELIIQLRTPDQRSICVNQFDSLEAFIR